MKSKRSRFEIKIKTEVDYEYQEICTLELV